MLHAACVVVVVCGAREEGEARSGHLCAGDVRVLRGAKMGPRCRNTHARAHTHTQCRAGLLACNRWRARRKRACSDMSLSSMWMATGAGGGVLEEEKEPGSEGCADAAPAQDERHQALVG